MPLNFVAKAAVTVALSAANYALQASRKIEGPRLEELGASVGDYGAPIPDIFGMRRVSPPVFWAEDLREVKRRRKTKGGKYNEYTYYGTWACALAGHEIEGVTRIWFDTHLVYDMTGAGPVSPFDFGGTGSITDFIAIYLGTMAQEPDERMAATVEAEHGAGSCPAYHGTAYVVFKDMPLEKLGNRIPQVSVEVVSAVSALWPYESAGDGYGGSNLFFSQDFSTVYAGSYVGMSIYDNAARAMINDISATFAGTGNRQSAYDDYGFVGLSEGLDDLYQWDVYGGSALLYNAPGFGFQELTTAMDGDGDWHWAAFATSAGDLYVDGAVFAEDFSNYELFTDLDGNVWIAGREDATTLKFVLVSGASVYPSTITVSGLSSGGLNGAGLHYRDATDDHFIFRWDGLLYAVTIDSATATVVYSYSGTHGTPAFRDIRPGTETFWAGFYEISSKDLTLVRSIGPSATWGLSITTTNQMIYDPINHALVRFSNGPQWLYLDRISGAGVTLGEIAANRAVKVGVEDYDFTSLDQIVYGWSVTQGPASSQLEPLFDAYDSDILPHEFGIVGKKRAGVSASTLLTENFVAGDPRYKARVRQSAELPFALTYNFADMAADQQPNNVRVARPQDAQAGRDERSIDLTTLASSADEMRGLAERHFRRIHGERREFELGLTTQKIALEPGDVHTLDLDGDQLSARLLKTTISPAGTIETEWRYDHASFAVLSGANGAEMDGRPDSAVVIPLLSRGFFLDIPYITDSDARTPPSIYILAAPFATGTWPGAVAYQAIDGEYSDEIGAVPSSSAATWGYANAVLPDANPWLWDRSSEINVTLQNGTLTGCTEAQIDADPDLNLILFGDELMNFTTATLEMDGTWTLSGFKRGRRGTEWACSTHALRDVVLLMDTAQAVNMGLDEVDTDLSFKMITSGRSTGFAIDLEPFNGASLMPWAPCHLTATLDSVTGDWVFTWVRRTRIGGAWTGGAAIPLSEASEEYQLYLGDGVTDVTKTVTSATTYTWTAAQQTTDTGSAVTSGELTFSMAQVSDAVGAGFVAVY